MKIKTKSLPFEKVMSLPRPKHRPPMKPSRLLQTVVRVIAIPELFKTRFSFTTERLDEAGDGPKLILMNHSSFLDLKIAFRILYPKRFAIVSTMDSFVGKAWLMRWLGCIPTHKFVNDVTLINDIHHSLHKNKVNVLMYPEAGYSFDGRATALPQSFGLLLKHLDVSVIGITTFGAFAYDPLYNELQTRKVKVSAHAKCLITRDEIREKSVAELDELVGELFGFDNFAWQKENEIKITENFRADGLNRILYKCIDCGVEGEMIGKGTTLRCEKCGSEYELSEDGTLVGKDVTRSVTEWYDYQRECVRDEIERGEYKLETDVEVAMLVNYKALYKIGSGHLSHDISGFKLTGGEGKLDYKYPSMASHSLNSDFFWYELGDVIGIGNRSELYYCFPKDKDVVTKARLAAEEIYKKKRRRTPKKKEQ